MALQIFSFPFLQFSVSKVEINDSVVLSGQPKRSISTISGLNREVNSMVLSAEQAGNQLHGGFLTDSKE